MPIYEYACVHGHAFEELVIRSADAAEVVCPQCGSREVTRRISRPAATPSASSDGAPARQCGPVG